MICPILNTLNWSNNQPKRENLQKKVSGCFAERISSPSSPGRRLKPSSSTSGVAWGKRQQGERWRLLPVCDGRQRRHHQTIALLAVLHINVIQISHIDRLERSASWLRLLLADKLCSSSFHSARWIIFRKALHSTDGWEWKERHSSACLETLPECSNQ